MTMLSMQVAGMDRLYLMYGALYERTRRTMEIENDRSAMPLATDADLRHQIGLPPLEDTKTEEDVEVLDSEMAGHETVEVEAGNDVSTTTDNDEASDGPLPQMIPKLLKNVVDKKLQVYIDHAWGTQTWMTRGSQYDSESERIVVIDSKTSGEIQPSSVYSEGLHQFLQIHNGCELTPESLNSVFITNGSFVQMYSHVVGITGTIGPKHDQNALVRGLGARNVKFSFLPRSKYRPYTQLPPLVVDDKDMWHSLWMRELKQCIKTGRPVLIIFRDKCVAEEEAKLIEGKLGVQVKRYIINDPKLQSYRPSDLLGPGDIVVSTNFGGRGTDYKLTDTAVKNGGLHTVVTFSASSVRQVGQAFGRSARAGDPGSGVLVAYNGLLQSKDLYSRHEELQDEMQRNYYESLSDQIKHNMYLNRYCDQLFQDFAKVHNKVSSSLHDTQNPVKAVHSCTALRDRFGIFIDELRHDLADRWIHGDKCSDMKWIGEECKARFMDWARGVVTAIKHDKNVITNECSMVVYARDLIEKYPDVKVNRGQLNEALTMTKNAIDSDAFMAGPAAHMLRLKIELKLRRLKSRDEGDHKVVTQLLDNARQAFELELDFVQSISALVCHKRQDTALAKQLQETTNVLLYMHDSVNQALTCCTIEFDKRGQSDDDHYYYEAEFDHLPDDISETTKRIYKENLAVNGHIGLLRLEAKREWSWSWYVLQFLLTRS
ncbi:Protein translocase subunit SecA [Phytophthora citrophthora]|uniref:Protein translocase subunit SecA n=1 Tax=Phytophthora citrophthora TaxID=4793 RepID=A0AAD9G5P5_9STRA|nr:Protein translocase subunit SecA [Phytophthora citrophthora]